MLSIRDSPANVGLGGDDLVFRLPKVVSFVHHVTDGSREVQIVVYSTSPRHMPTGSLWPVKHRMAG